MKESVNILKRKEVYGMNKEEYIQHLKQEEHNFIEHIVKLLDEKYIELYNEGYEAEVIRETLAYLDFEE